MADASRRVGAQAGAALERRVAVGHERLLALGDDALALAISVGARGQLIQVRLGDHEAVHEPRIARRYDDGDVTAEAVSHQVNAREPTSLADAGDHAGVVLERVAPVGRAITQAEPRQVHDERAMASEPSIERDVAEDPRPAAAEAVDEHARRRPARDLCPTHDRAKPSNSSSCIVAPRRTAW